MIFFNVEGHQGIVLLDCEVKNFLKFEAKSINIISRSFQARKSYGFD